MPEALKDMYNESFIHHLHGSLSNLFPKLSLKELSQKIYTEDWKNKELKERMRHISTILHVYFPSSFPKAAPLLIQLGNHVLHHPGKYNGFAYMILPDYIQQFGINDYSSAIQCIEKITPLASCEFAVRPFLTAYPEAMHKQMVKWSQHGNFHVRRLSSEGTRPRLPWGMTVPHLKLQPEKNIPILQNLKQDASEYVRKSVANHLNDISKDFPELTLHWSKKWIGIHPDTDKLLKHACRNLLKSGDTEALGLFGHAPNPTIQLESFTLQHKKTTEKKPLSFSISLSNKGKEAISVRIEYAIYFLRQNGKHSKKVFKLGERNLQPKESYQYQKYHSFKPISTRKYYAGTQQVSIILNGKESQALAFQYQEIQAQS